MIRLKSHSRHFPTTTLNPFSLLLPRPAAEKVVARTLALEKVMAGLSDAALSEKWSNWGLGLSRQHFRLDTVIAEALACVREIAARTTGLKAFPCQLRATITLIEPAITEVATGEGKTLITAMAASLLALHRKGVHVATVNSYLAERDHEFASLMTSRLGLSIGLLAKDQSQEDKRAAYLADITYGTGYDFGFDYLRDQLALLKHSQAGPTLRLRNVLLGKEHVGAATVQGPLNFAIVDEIDSVLIDEASSPLVIAEATATGQAAAAAYALAHKTALALAEDLDFTCDHLGKNPRLTEGGRNSVNQLPQIPWDALVRPWHLYVKNALQALHSFHLGEHYIVQDGKIVIVDEFTGRAHEERSWQQGLHQAVAAKEGLEIPQETQTAANITRQRYFRLYDSLSGLTGTALESRAEFRHFFRLPVRSVPPHRPCLREILPDRYYQTRSRMLQAVADEVAFRWRNLQPVLVGTRTVSISEELSSILSTSGIPHRTLNAKQDKDENDIIANAGELGSVVVATNMAGRGTHISLPDRSLQLGGLHVIGVERSESSRVDRQLIGRCARQGQPGSAVFFVSAEDNLVQQFAPEIGKQMARMPAAEDGRLPESTGKLFLQLQRRVQKVRYHQRLRMESRDRWMDQTRKNLA